VCKKKRKRFLLKGLFVELLMFRTFCVQYSKFQYHFEAISYLTAEKPILKPILLHLFKYIWVIALSDLLYIKIYSWRYQLGFKLKKKIIKNNFWSVFNLDINNVLKFLLEKIGLKYPWCQGLKKKKKGRNKVICISVVSSLFSYLT
jgi:hypothetical protein